MKTIKPFSDIKIGNIAFKNPTTGGEWNTPGGPVVWKGNIDQLFNSIWKNHFSDWDMSPKEAVNIDFVVIDTDDWGHVLFNYDYDPCGVVCFED